MSLLISDDPLALKQAAQKMLTFSAQTVCGSCAVARGAETCSPPGCCVGGKSVLDQGTACVKMAMITDIPTPRQEEGGDSSSRMSVTFTTSTHCISRHPAGATSCCLQSLASWHTLFTGVTPDLSTNVTIT